MQSIKSNALEPTRPELASLSRGQAILRLLPVYGLPLLTILLIVLFSILLPDTFPTWLNFRSILADKSIVAMLALAATLPMMAGRIDLTVGFGIVMWHILAISSPGLVRRPLAAGDPPGRRLLRLCRAAQRSARRDRAGRRVRRDARDRHHPLCARALAYRRPAGHRYAAEGLSRDQLDDRSAACRYPPSM